MANIIPIERIETKIYYIRGQKVMLDRDLAKLYGVKTKVLNQAVKRNIKRFPEDFMFQLNNQEKIELVTNCDHLSSMKFAPTTPYVFTEQGIAMLSTVLNSEKAIDVNIQIMRTFTKLRQLLSGNEVLRQKIESMERKYDSQFKIVFKAIKELLDKEKQVPKKRRIGFITE